MISQRIRVLRVIVLATLPLLVLALVWAWQEMTADQARTAEDRLKLARAAVLVVDSFVGGNLSTTQSLALVSEITETTEPERAADLLGRLAQVNSDWAGIAIIGADGWNLASNASAPRAVFVGDRPYFQELLATGRPVVSPAVMGRRFGIPTVVLAVPVDFTAGGRGAIITPLPIDRLDAALHAALGTASIRIVVVDQTGQILAHPAPTQPQGLVSRLDQPWVQAVLAGEAGTRVVPVDGQETLVAYAPVPAFGWGVIVEEPTAVAFAPLRQALAQRIELLALTLLLVGVIAWWFGGRLSALYDRLVVAREQAEAAERRAEFLAEAGRELASTLDHATILELLTRLVATSLADWCAIHLAEPDGALRRVAVAHRDPVKETLLREDVEHFPPWEDLEPLIGQVVQSGRPRLESVVLDPFLTATMPDPAHRHLVRTVGFHSLMCVPIEAHGQRHGSLTLVSGQDRIPFGSADLLLAEGLARRAALAIDNARLHREVQEAARTRDEFLAAASHDLKNPLASIKGAAQVLQRRIVRHGSIELERLSAGLRSIDTSATAMSHLIDALLDVTRLQMGRPLELQCGPVDLSGLARRVVAECQQATDRHSLRLEGPEEMVGQWDATRLERMLGNLLDNALKYSPDGGDILVRLTREADVGGEWAILTVTDHGLGIPQEDLSRVFERFQRGRNVVGRISGTGIGLAGVRQIVEQHDGTIQVQSQVGLETTFIVRLPLVSAEQPAVPAEIP